MKSLKKYFPFFLDTAAMLILMTVSLLLLGLGFFLKIEGMQVFGCFLLLVDAAFLLHTYATFRQLLEEWASS